MHVNMCKTTRQKAVAGVVKRFNFASNACPQSAFCVDMCVSIHYHDSHAVVIIAINIVDAIVFLAFSYEFISLSLSVAW